MAMQVLLTKPGDKLSLPAFTMTRQPILDRHQEAVAFDLSFQSAQGTPDAAGKWPMIDDILDHFTDLDLLKVVGELRGIVHVDGRALMSDVFQHIPRARFVFNLSPGMTVSDAMLERLAHLAGQGFQFSLNEAGTDEACLRRLLPMVEMVRFDLRQHPLERLVELTSRPYFANKKLLAENVDTLARFDACLALGFDYLQGFYFAHPAIQPERTLAPSQAAIIDIISLVESDADSAEIETHIKRDVSLSLNLLRLVNSAAVGVHRIDSLRQALMVLGRKQLANWLQVMLYTQSKENAPSARPLLMLATTRGKLMELVALHHRPGNRAIADSAFTVGIMSLMDVLFGMPMAEIVRQIPVVEEIGDALLDRQGYFGDLLALIETIERGANPSVLLPMLGNFHLDCNSLYLLQADAFEWSNSVTHANP